MAVIAQAFLKEAVEIESDIAKRMIGVAREIQVSWIVLMCLVIDSSILKE